jgi:hypothetical protein
MESGRGFEVFDTSFGLVMFSSRRSILRWHALLPPERWPSEAIEASQRTSLAILDAMPGLVPSAVEVVWVYGALAPIDAAWSVRAGSAH